MVTDDDRRRIASECRERAYREEFTGEAVARVIGTFTSGTTRYDHDAWYRLADLIAPDDMSQSRRDTVACCHYSADSADSATEARAEPSLTTRSYRVRREGRHTHERKD